MVGKKESSISFEIRLWNPKHYDRPTNRKSFYNPFDGFIVRKGKSPNLSFHSVGELLTKLEKEFWEEVRSKEE